MSGVDYVNTFGGNPIWCAMALAVLDVLGNEGLQGKVREVGVDVVGLVQDLQ